MTLTKMAAARLHACGIRRSLRLSTATALLLAASPSFAQSIVAEGAVDPTPPAGNSCG